MINKGKAGFSPFLKKMYLFIFSELKFGTEKNMVRENQKKVFKIEQKQKKFGTILKQI